MNKKAKSSEEILKKENKKTLYIELRNQFTVKESNFIIEKLNNYTKMKERDSISKLRADKLPQNPYHINKDIDVLDKLLLEKEYESKLLDTIKILFRQTAINDSGVEFRRGLDKGHDEALSILCKKEAEDKE